MSDTNKMRDEFEREWGQVDSAQGVHFIPELNTYGSELYAQHEYAQMKSSAWFYFQKGWKASREALVITLPNTECFGEYSQEAARVMRDSCADAIEDQGIKFEVSE